MSDSSFSALVPGFDFLQGLVKNAGAALPGIGQWVAPTIDPTELEKRIEELRTVQFWLEQNAKMLGATIQALEVQRMTLSTLKTMNVQMEGLREAMTIRIPEPPAAPPPERPRAAAPAPEPAPEPESEPATEPDTETQADAPPAGADAAPSRPAAGVVDPMQWWGALTKQFADLAASAMKDGARAVAAPGTSVATDPPPPRAAGGAKQKASRGRPGATRKPPAAAAESAGAKSTAAKRGGARNAPAKKSPRGRSAG